MALHTPECVRTLSPRVDRGCAQVKDCFGGYTVQYVKDVVNFCDCYQQAIVGCRRKQISQGKNNILKQFSRGKNKLHLMWVFDFCTSTAFCIFNHVIINFHFRSIKKMLNTTAVVDIIIIITVQPDCPDQGRAHKKT